MRPPRARARRSPGSIGGSHHGDRIAIGRARDSLSAVSTIATATTMGRPPVLAGAGTPGSAAARAVGSGPLAEGSRVAQRPDPGRVVAEHVGEDRVGVLPELGCL